MIQRCTNKNSNIYPRYGGKGITICDRWRDSFQNFLADMGEKPVGKTLDRKNNKLGYCKRNCRWATMIQQGSNKSNNHIIQWRGEKKTVSEWCRHFGWAGSTIYNRQKLGWSVRRIMNTPIVRHHSRGNGTTKRKQKYQQLTDLANAAAMLYASTANLNAGGVLESARSNLKMELNKFNSTEGKK